MPRRGRDLRLDFLRGLAMTCVIVDHSKRTSILSWFSYQRFWVVTAAEVFVVLSGVAIGMVYGPRLVRDGWVSVANRLARRALLLYVAFIAVTLSILGLALAGVDVAAVASWDPDAVQWFMNPRAMTPANWLELALLRHGPWAFEIVGLYVWLVLGAIPCLIALHFGGWRALLMASWAAYLSYHIAPRELTGAEFEIVFPILAWQLLFVHGLVIGYHRERLAAIAARCPSPLLKIVTATSAGFAAFALCNPSANFADLYARYFSLTELGIGRLLNLAVALPVGYSLLASRALSAVAARLQPLFVTLGQASLGAFVLHVYGLLLLSHLPTSDQLWINTTVQLLLIGGIAAGLRMLPGKGRRRAPVMPTADVYPAVA